MLAKIAENNGVLEKLRNRLLSVKAAYSEVLGLTVKPISSEKASFGERGSEKASQKSEVKQGEEKTQEPQKVEQKTGLSDEDIGLTPSLQQAMQGKGRFQPVGPEKGEEETDEELSLRKCPICGQSFQSRKETAFILVHKHEKNMAIRALKSLHSERESPEADSPQSEVN